MIGILHVRCKTGCQAHHHKLAGWRDNRCLGQVALAPDASDTRHQSGNNASTSGRDPATDFAGDSMCCASLKPPHLMMLTCTTDLCSAVNLLHLSSGFHPVHQLHRQSSGTDVCTVTSRDHTHMSCTSMAAAHMLQAQLYTHKLAALPHEF